MTTSYNSGHIQRGSARPSTFDAPLSWSTTPRTSRSAADLGYAIEPPPRRSYSAAWCVAVVLLSVIATVVITVGH